MTADTVVSDGVLIDVSDLCLDDLLGLELLPNGALRTALDRVIATPTDCANSFQSSI
jgi:hypothetical protein